MAHRSRLLPVVAAVMAVVLGASAGTAGWSFLWCEPMQEARLSCCCPSEHTHEDRIARTCCEDRSLDAIASADSLERAPRTFAASLVAVLPIALVLGRAELDGEIAGPPMIEARAGPSQRVHAQSSVYLI